MNNFRTDNAIKNHFYSKLRKFIRKMLKQLNKENLLKANSIDMNKYNSDYVYKIIKKNKLPYNNLNKDTILNLIINHDKNVKNGKLDSQFLRAKTNRKKIIKNVGIAGQLFKVGENMYEEKVIKRRNKDEWENEHTNSIHSKKINTRERIGNKQYPDVFVKRNVDCKDKTAMLFRRNLADRDDIRKNSLDENKIKLCKNYFS